MATVRCFRYGQCSALGWVGKAFVCIAGAETKSGWWHVYGKGAREREIEGSKEKSWLWQFLEPNASDKFHGTGLLLYGYWHEWLVIPASTVDQSLSLLILRSDIKYHVSFPICAWSSTEMSASRNAHQPECCQQAKVILKPTPKLTRNPQRASALTKCPGRNSNERHLWQTFLLQLFLLN